MAHGHYLVGVVPSLPAVPTAVAVVHQVVIRNERARLETAELLLRHLELVPAGTGLAELGRHVAELAALLAREDQTAAGPALLVDVSTLGHEPWVGRFGAHKPRLVVVTAGTGEADDGDRRHRVGRVTLAGLLDGGAAGQAAEGGAVRAGRGAVHLARGRARPGAGLALVAARSAALR